MSTHIQDGLYDRIVCRPEDMERVRKMLIREGRDDIVVVFDRKGRLSEGQTLLVRHDATLEESLQKAPQGVQGPVLVDDPQSPGDGQAAPSLAEMADLTSGITHKTCDSCHQIIEPCVCNTGPDTDGPDEHCPQHGRLTSDWIERYDKAQGIINRVKAEIQNAPDHSIIGIRRLRRLLEGKSPW